MLMAKLMRSLIILAVSLVICACAGILDSNEPAERVYWLQPTIMAGVETTSEIRHGIVVTIRAAPGLDTDRILILQPGSRLNHYQAARWPDNAPDVIESLFRQTLESTGNYARVSGRNNARTTDWRLQLELREFYSTIDPTGTDFVRVALSGHASCNGLDYFIQLSSSNHFENERLRVVVAAYQRALDDISTSLVDELSAACATGPSQAHEIELDFK